MAEAEELLQKQKLSPKLPDLYHPNNRYKPREIGSDTLQHNPSSTETLAFPSTQDKQWGEATFLKACLEEEG